MTENAETAERTGVSDGAGKDAIIEIKQVGERVPRLFFVNDGVEPYYFKEDLVLPEGEFEKPEEPAIGTLYTMEYHYQIIVSCARNSVRIAPHRTLSTRAVATYRLAEQLGISDLVAKTEFAELTYAGERLFGTRMEPVRGVTYSDLKMFSKLKGYRLSYTPKTVRELTILMLFDFVCGQVDRHTKNIKYTLNLDLTNIAEPKAGADEIVLTGVCGIDHDLSFGELSYDMIKERVSAGVCICPEFMGKMQYTAVDMPFFERICGIDEDAFRREFSELLSDGEMDAFFDRRNGLIRAVSRQKEIEDGLRGEQAEFFPRLLYAAEQYEEYLARMEENALRKPPKRTFRFNYHPSYLQPLPLTHEPLSGRE